jgi:hypothetical protein
MNRTTPHRVTPTSRLPKQGVLPARIYNQEKLAEWYRACGAMRGDDREPVLSTYVFCSFRTGKPYASGYIAFFNGTASRHRRLSDALAMLVQLEENYHLYFATKQRRLQDLSFDPKTREQTDRELQAAIDGEENGWSDLLRYQREQHPEGKLGGWRGDKERAARARANRKEEPVRIGRHKPGTWIDQDGHFRQL